MIEELLKRSKNIFVVSCEAGGAEIISSLLRRNPDGNYCFCLEGPAEKILQGKLGELKTAHLDYIKNMCSDDLLLTGTSWIPSLERDAIKLARENKLPSASIIDHYTHYQERFLPKELWGNIPSNWTDFLPDNVFVCDEYAYELALKKGFPEKKLKRMDNPYFQDLNEEIKSLRKEKEADGTFKLLYLSEPIHDDLVATYGDPDYWGYDEFDLAEYLVESVNKNLCSGKKIEARFRLHPNEKKDKYDKYIKECNAMSRSENADLLEDLAWSDAILGGESIALIIALNAGKPVYSFLPKSSKKPCALPHKEIMRIDNIDKIFSNI
jgi:hypothetical protein